jgi:ABC-2 type transport system ATP-binding protein
VILEEKIMSHAIIVNKVHKKFGKSGTSLWKRALKLEKNGHKEKSVVIAVNQVSFNIEQGEIFGVLGPNGSGKSTLIRLIATLLLPDDGNIQVSGHDVVAQSLEVQKLINRVSVEASFFKKLSPMENLMYGARLYGIGGREVKKRVVARHAAKSCHRAGAAF